MNELADSPLTPARARAQAPEAPAGTRVGLRGIALGLVCVAALSAATVYSDLVLRGTVIARNALPIGVLAIFCGLLIVVNTALRRLHRRLAFTSHELLTAYIMMLVAASLPSLGLTVVVLNMIPSADYFAARQPTWEPAFFQYIPNAVRLTDPDAVRGFYEGIPKQWPIPWGPWLRPLAVWTTFAFLWFFAYFCLAVLVRRQWVERERLAFPLAELPLEIARGDERPTARSPFFRNWVMWLGFALPWLIYNLNSLQRYLPSLPSLQLAGIPVAQGLSSLPWSALRNTSVTISFAVIGLTYLISSQVAGSSVFFWAVVRLGWVLLAAFGITATGNADPTEFTITWFTAHQEMGATLAIAVISMWSMRSLLIRPRYAQDGLSSVWGLSTEQWAAGGFIISFGLIGVWAAALGASFFWQIFFVGIYTVSAFGLVRLVAAGGFMWVDVSYSPVDPMLQLFSTAAFTPRDLTLFSYEGIFCWWNVGWSNMMQFATTGLRIATVAKLNLRRMAVAIALGCLLATVIGYWLSISFAYRGVIPRETGYLTAELPSFHFDKLVVMLQRPVPVQWTAIADISLGFVVMWCLETAARQWAWFGLNPLGYLIGLSYVMDVMWFPILVGWLANVLTNHYLGLRGYRRLRPFFLGLILGEFLTAAQWILIDALTGVHGHNLLG